MADSWPGPGCEAGGVQCHNHNRPRQFYDVLDEDRFTVAGAESVTAVSARPRPAPTGLPSNRRPTAVAAATMGGVTREKRTETHTEREHSRRKSADAPIDRHSAVARFVLGAGRESLASLPTNRGERRVQIG